MSQIGPQARYSQDQRHRWAMWFPTPLGGSDVWADKWCVFIGLNPLLTEFRHDHEFTRKLTLFALREGAGVCVVVNLYSIQTATHAELRDMIGANGPQNNHAIAHYATRQGTKREDMKPIVIACWGAPSDYREDGAAREAEVTRNLRHLGVHLQCFGMTKDHHPRHPALLDPATKLEPYPTTILFPNRPR